VAVSDIGRRFSQLLIRAMERPVSIDRGALLNAASAFLDAARFPESDGLTLARRMAFRTMEWCTMDRPEDYAALRRAVGAFQMHAHITH
jgi:hypothetical protein